MDPEIEVKNVNTVETILSSQTENPISNTNLQPYGFPPKIENSRDRQSQRVAERTEHDSHALSPRDLRPDGDHKLKVRPHIRLEPYADVDEQAKEGGSDEFVGQFDEGVAEEEGQGGVGGRGLTFCGVQFVARVRSRLLRCYYDEKRRAHHARITTCLEGR